MSFHVNLGSGRAHPFSACEGHTEPCAASEGGRGLGDRVPAAGLPFIIGSSPLTPHG